MSISSLSSTAIINTISSLGNSSGSILPLFAKDTLNCVGVSYVFSKKGGKHDGKEKAVEEFGTQAIWLLGIPIVKKIFDKTIYKVAGINPDVDIRKFKPEFADNIENTIGRLTDGSQKDTLANVAKNQKLTKGLFIAKFAVATIATMAALHALIVYKQKTTRKQMYQEAAEQKFLEMKLSNASQGFNFKGVQKKENETPTSFKGAGKEFITSFMYNPVRNMSILDGGIFAKRMDLARKGEKGEVAFKEVSTIGFLYVLAKPIQKGLEAIGKKLTGLPLALDYRVLADENFKEYLTKGKNNELVESISHFYSEVNPTFKAAPKARFSLKNVIAAAADKLKGVKVDDGFDNNAIINYIYKNQDSPLVKMLKASGDVKLYKEEGKKILGFIPNPKKIVTDQIDSLAFIDTSDVKSTVSNLSSFIEKADAIPNALKKAKSAKTASIFANIAIAAVFLAVVQPLVIIAARKINNNGDPNNPAIRAEEEEIRNTFA